MQAGRLRKYSPVLNKMVEVQCKYCGGKSHVMTSGQYNCCHCNIPSYFDTLKPGLFWTLCKPCHYWIGHEKYKTSIECHKCGDILITL